jgi:DNA-binding CsgD family transcriptional regulator
MLSLSDFNLVLSLIYEAALVPQRWDIALTSLMDRFAPREWHVAFIVWERIQPPAGRFIGSTGVHPLARDAYLEHFAGRQEWSTRGHELKLGTIVEGDDLIPRDEFKQTPFYKHYLGPWGYEQAIIGMLDRNGPDHLGIVCPGPAGESAIGLREAITMLTPHIQRAVRISRRIGEADLRANTATDLLNASPYCVMALGPGLEMLMANNHGQQLLEKSGCISAQHGRLHISCPTTAKMLTDMASGKNAERSFTFSITGNDEQQLVMTALAVSQAQSGQFANHAGGTALMLVGGQRLDLSETVIAALQDAFALTKSEARLAAFLLKGSGVQGYTADRGVSHEAGKYLLKNIYAKTGLSNQTELIAMLREAPLGWGPPLPPAIAAP